MTMRIGKEVLTRCQIFNIVTEQPSLKLDAEIQQEFLKSSKEKVCELDKINFTKLNEMFLQEKDNLQYSKIFIMNSLQLLIKYPKDVRITTIQYLIDLLNEKKPISLVSGQNFFSLFFENTLGEQVQQLNECEFQLLEKNFGNLALFSKSQLQINNLLFLLGLSKLAFSLFCEQNSINTDFLKMFQDKMSQNKKIGQATQEIQNLLYGTKSSKTNPVTNIVEWVDIQGTVQNMADQLDCSVNEHFELFINDRVIKSALKLKIDQGKIGDIFFVQVKNLMEGISSLISSFSSLFKLSLKEAKNEAIVGKLTSIISIIQNYESKVGPNDQIIYNFEQVLQFFKEVLVISLFESLVGICLKDVKEEENSKKKKKEVAYGQGTTEFIKLFKDGLGSTQLADSYEYVSTWADNSDNTIAELICATSQNKNLERRLPKIPKGTRDFDPFQMTIRRQVFDTIAEIFKRFGAVEIDTPVFECKETLTGKYGEDSKLIYDLEDQGGELLSLRYDLTVPFARYLAVNKIVNIKRFHIGKVYRRDQPKKGRYREFYQCDFDISGVYDSMMPDAEIITVIDTILKTIDLGAKHTIKVNNRKILDAMIQLSGAPASKFKPICSAIDKLDKETWEEVKLELVQKKGISNEVCDKLEIFIKYRGQPLALLKQIRDDKIFEGSEVGQVGLQEMEKLFEYLECLNSIKNVSFDLSLARGLEYYTGMIFEAVLEGAQVGSISGGGRYDNLVGMFGTKQIPAVGGSIGVERIFSILEDKKSVQQRQNDTQVLVCTIGGNLVKEKLRIATELLEQKIKTEYLLKDKPKTSNQIQYALDNFIPFMIWIGEDEIQNKQVNLKCTYLKTEEKVPRDQLLSVLMKKIETYYDDLANNKVIYEIQDKGKKDQEEEKQ